MLRQTLKFLFIAMVSFFVMGTVRADSIPVANYSFELPVVPSYANPPAWPIVADWIELDVDTTGNSQNTGVFTDVTNIAGADANQLAFLGGERGNALLQDLSSTYEVGKSYRMTVGVCVSSQYPPYDPNGLELAFYYTNPGDPNRLDIVTVLTDEPSHFTSTQLEDNSVYLPAVEAADAWAGKPIGIAIRATGPMGGYWDLDNVRVMEYVRPNFTGDPMVNFADFAMMAAEWLLCGDLSTDVTGDGCVDEQDFLILAEYWLDNG